MRRVFLGLCLITVSVVAVSCSSGEVGQGTTIVTATPSTSSAATTSTPPPSSTAPMRTVTVTNGPSTTRRTVTRVVQVPAPSSSGALTNLLDNASVADPSGYYDGGELFFDSPSQNIGCYLGSSGTASCAIHDYDFPQNGPDCNAGIAADLDESGYPSLLDCSAYFPVANRGQVLQYGTALENGDVACVSEPAGVTCVNTASQSGFTISKQAFTPVY